MKFPLFEACRNGNENNIKYILAHRANANDKRKNFYLKVKPLLNYIYSIYLSREIKALVKNLKLKKNLRNRFKKQKSMKILNDEKKLNKNIYH